MTQTVSGHLTKMSTELDSENLVRYTLDFSGQTICLNDYLGKPIKLQFMGAINCTHCGRKSNKSFSQGYCYPCFKKLPQCDLCMMSPERCHYDAGTCRDPEWGEGFCMTDHIVYLAKSSNPKVGITRITQVPTRWIDQGAVEAMPLFRVATRQQSGLLEDKLRQHVADKTNWRAMLKGEVADVDLKQLAEQLIDLCADDIAALQAQFGLQAISHIVDASVQPIAYPVIEYPSKIKTFNFDKTEVVEGVLMGIKGQYLLLDTGVINIRKFTAYNVAFRG